MEPPLPKPDDVLTFWFVETDPARWWKKDETFDRLIRDRFSAVHARASRCELWEWRTTPRGRLAEILVLDQFSRNLFRESPLAFAQDPLALGLAQEIVTAGADQALRTVERSFVYLPYMHSESLAIHREAVRLYKALGSEQNLAFERAHQRILERFGRYPHRNQALGRISTSEEEQFLSEPGSGF